MYREEAERIYRERQDIKRRNEIEKIEQELIEDGVNRQIWETQNKCTHLYITKGIGRMMCDKCGFETNKCEHVFVISSDTDHKPICKICGYKGETLINHPRNISERYPREVLENVNRIINNFFEEDEDMDGFEKFKKEIEMAIRRYGDEHVDISVSDGEVYGFYHSLNNSFSVTDTYDLEEDIGGWDNIKILENKYEHLCVCTD